MKKQARKWIALALVLGTLLAACGSSGGETQVVPGANAQQLREESLPTAPAPQVQTTPNPAPGEAAPARLQSFDIVAGIDITSVVSDDEGVWFTSYLPNGQPVRFWGSNILVEKGQIYFGMGGELLSLDAIGRIHSCTPVLSEYDPENCAFYAGYGYTFHSGKSSVTKPGELCSGSAVTLGPEGARGQIPMDLTRLQPNFICFGNGKYQSGIRVEALTFRYDPGSLHTPVRSLWLDENSYGAYLEGDHYVREREVYTGENGQAQVFSLIAQMDTPASGSGDPATTVRGIPGGIFSVGMLKDGAGYALDKANARVYRDTTLEVTLGDTTLDIPLPMLETCDTAVKLHDLTPYAAADALGQADVLVVPVFWSDQPFSVTEDSYQRMLASLGRVHNLQGEETDYSRNYGGLSLSQYYDMSSYGQLRISSFVTDWYCCEGSYWQAADQPLSYEYANDALAWVKQTYPTLDMGRYDKDGNGYIDYMILLNVGQGGGNLYASDTPAGAVCYTHSYFGDYSGTPGDPRVNTYVSINMGRLTQESNVLIHEFAHALGLQDYYDLTYSGIEPVGRFDMQSAAQGDWNAYSKYAVGWLQPRVVLGLNSGDALEITIGSSAVKGEAILIPGAESQWNGTPFDEYILVELLTDEGVNPWDTRDPGVNLQGMAGIRISHVNATMEKHTMNQWHKLDPERGETAYVIGRNHFDNSSKPENRGYYHIEVIQAGGINTFTNVTGGRRALTKADLFYPGQSFSLESHGDFFWQGRMDDGKDFGYRIEVVDIFTDAAGDYAATLRIIRQ